LSQVLLAFEDWLSVHRVDAGSSVCAIIAGWRKAFLSNATATNTNKAMANAMNGAALFPFLALILVPFSDHILDAVLHSSKVTFGLAGVIGAFWTVNELRR
jgi:hypothetical protein